MTPPLKKGNYSKNRVDFKIGLLVKYLHLSIFDRHIKRHGGTRRSEQLRELLESAESISGVTINPYLDVNASLRLSLRHPIMFGRALMFSVWLYVSHGLSFKGFLQYAVCSVNLLIALKRHSFDLVLHETAPGISIPFMHYMVSCGINYVAIPHNIEYLVPGQVMKAFSDNHRLYQTEIEGYRGARQVLAICDFDTAILRCSGVNAHTLEYRPTRTDRERCKRIREAREARDNFDGFLLLGTVENTPTFNGIKALLDTLSMTHPELRVTVAGYGTEVFRPYQSKTVNVLGAVSEAHVEALLVSAKVLLINQPQTTGFLTKIIEMNLSGVPQAIISDYFQADGLARFGVIKTTVESLHRLEVPARFESLPEIEPSLLLQRLLSEKLA